MTEAIKNINTINAGSYGLEPSILDIIAADATCSFEYDIFPDILKKEMPFFAYTMKDEYWQDIGTPASYLKAHHDLLGGTVTGFEPERSTVYEAATKAQID